MKQRVESVSLSVRRKKRQRSCARRGVCVVLRRRKRINARLPRNARRKEDGAPSPKTVTATCTPTTAKAKSASVASKVNDSTRRASLFLIRLYTASRISYLCNAGSKIK